LIRASVNSVTMNAISEEEYNSNSDNDSESPYKYFPIELNNLD